ncbi:MAG TPA: hypothetical protein VN636_16990, partial [Acidimicrobiia bacterium]|nr:hypothetical protein [Acidimicrobiia bacterium]
MPSRCRPRLRVVSGIAATLLLSAVLASCSTGAGKGAAHTGTTAASGAGGAPIGRDTVGRTPGGGVVTPSGQIITPAGTQVELPGRPLAVAIRPDGRTAALLSGTSIQAGSAPLLTVIDLSTAKVVQQFAPEGATVASFGGLVYSPDGNHLYASALNAVV